MLGEVLVQVAEKASVPRRVSEVVRDYARLGVDALECFEKQPCAVSRWFEEPQWVVATEDVARRRQGPVPGEDVTQPVAVVVRGMTTQVSGALFAGKVTAVPWPVQQRVVDEAVVLAEAHEHAAEHPGHRHLRIQALGPLRLR